LRSFWLYRELKGLLPGPACDRQSYFCTIEAYLETKPYDLVFFLEHGVFPWRGDGFRIEDQEPMTALLLGITRGRFRHVLASTGTEVVLVPREATELESRRIFCLGEISKLVGR
jgi:hypothetical protein